MAAPTIKVEVAFASQPFDSVQTYTDVTSYVTDIQYSNGRSYQLDRIEAGTATVVFDNADGRFTPGRAASPYYPNVKAKRRLRITATYSGTPYVVHSGFIERWPVVFNGSLSTVTVTSVDAMRHLSDITLKSFFTSYFLNILDDPLTGDTWSCYYPLSDAEGTKTAVCARNVGPSLTAISSGSGQVAFGSSDAQTFLLPGLAGGATNVKFTGNGATTNVSTLTMVDPVARLFEMSVCFNATAPAGYTMSVWESHEAYIRIDSSGNVITDIGTVGTIAFGQPVMIAYSRGIFSLGVTSNTIKINGVTAFSGNVSTGFPTVTFGATYYMDLGGNRSYSATPSQGFNGSMSHFYYSSQSNTVAVTSMSSLYANGIEEGEAARLSRLLDYIGWPAADRDIDTVSGSYGTLATPDYAEGSVALEVLQAAAESAGGVFYVDGQGRAAFQNRRARMKATASAYTLKDSTGTGPEPGLSFEESEDRVVNDVTVQRSSGATISRTDSTSISTYGRKSSSYTLGVNSDTQSADFATWLLYRTGVAPIEIQSLDFYPSASEALFPFVLNGKLSDLVTVDELPDAAPYTSGQFFVEGFSHTIKQNGGRVDWRTTVNLTPAARQTAWVLGTSALDSTAVAAY